MEDDGTDRAGAYTGSFVRRGKLYVSELDLRNAEVGTWGVWGTDFWRENHNAATFRRKAIFYATDSFVHGGAYHACDMGGGYYNTPVAMETWKTVNRVADHVRASAFRTADVLAKCWKAQVSWKRETGFSRLRSNARRYSFLK